MPSSCQSDTAAARCKLEGGWNGKHESIILSKQDFMSTFCVHLTQRQGIFHFVLLGNLPLLRVTLPQNHDLKGHMSQWTGASLYNDVHDRTRCL